MEIDSFLSYLKNIKRYSALTITAYKEDLNQFREFCEKVELIRQDEQITSKMVRRFEMGLMSGGLKIGGVDGEEKLRPMTARSVRRKLSSLRTYFRYLVREGKLTEDPTEIVVAPKMGKRLPVFVPDYQMDEVLDKHASDKDFANIRDRMVLMTAYYTGMRRSELVALKLEDVDLGGAVIRVNGKGDKQRIVPMLPELAGDLRIYLNKREELVGEKHQFVFVTDKGKPVYDKFIYRLAVKYLGEVTSLKKRSPHVLRHSFATALLNNGACIEAIRELLGHAGLAATQIYTHNSFESLKKVYNQAHPRA